MVSLYPVRVCRELFKQVSILYSKDYTVILRPYSLAQIQGREINIYFQHFVFRFCLEVCILTVLLNKRHVKVMAQAHKLILVYN